MLNLSMAKKKEAKPRPEKYEKASSTLTALLTKP
jgi:hypothetical protein